MMLKGHKPDLVTYYVRGTIWTYRGDAQALTSGPRVRLLARSASSAINAYMEAMRRRYGPCRKDVITVERAL